MKTLFQENLNSFCSWTHCYREADSIHAAPSVGATYKKGGRVNPSLYHSVSFKVYFSDPTFIHSIFEQTDQTDLTPSFQLHPAYMRQYFLSCLVTHCMGEHWSTSHYSPADTLSQWLPTTPYPPMLTICYQFLQNLVAINSFFLSFGNWAILSTSFQKLHDATFLQEKSIFFCKIRNAFAFK